MTMSDLKEQAGVTSLGPREAEGDHNIVFASLVTADNDIIGLVAYSIYKQNKHDWLVAFSRINGREPNEEELAAYIIGESTPRRLATFRRLAETTLEGRGPVTTASAAAAISEMNEQSNGAPPRSARGEGVPNNVFGSLVTGDSDIAGLVAYSIYKQNKRDWLVAFNRIKGREPNQSECAAYIVGESTPRRLTTFRHIAEATLEGRGPDVAIGNNSPPRNYAIATRHTPAAASAPSQNWGVIGLVGLALIAVIGFYLASRYGWIAGAKS